MPRKTYAASAAIAEMLDAPSYVIEAPGEGDEEVIAYSPVIIAEAQQNAWLAPDTSADALAMLLKPYAGREVVYVAGQNEGKLLVLDAGFTRMLGKIPLDPNGTRAMSGQKHPITDVGMRNLTAKLSKMWLAETQFAECNVTSMAHTAENPCKIRAVIATLYHALGIDPAATLTDGQGRPIPLIHDAGPIPQLTG